MRTARERARKIPQFLRNRSLKFASTIHPYRSPTDARWL
jgi:hypothetical protein